MADERFVAGDWGTSHLRLFLCNADGVTLDSNSGPGAAEVHGRFAETFGSLTARWRESHGSLQAVLCGMVGSNIGWTQTPYLACPAAPEQIADACVALCQGGVHVIPGLSCHNRFNAPDFLRGEETQILGVLRLVESLREDRWLLCLPGTHTKWVVLEDGVIQEFLTAPTGELFALLRDKSVLVRQRGGAEMTEDVRAFAAGLAHFNEFPQAQLLHRIFECRGRQISGEFAADAASAYLSGLLIASDVHGALTVLAAFTAAHPVYLIGAPELSELYAVALAAQGRDTVRVDGAAASLAGLAQVHRRLSQRVSPHDL